MPKLILVAFVKFSVKETFTQIPRFCIGKSICHCIGGALRWRNRVLLSLLVHINCIMIILSASFDGTLRSHEAKVKIILLERW